MLLQLLLLFKQNALEGTRLQVNLEPKKSWCAKESPAKI